MDIPGHHTPAGGTLPPNVTVSTLKPDIVVMDKQKKTVHIFELTCPAEHRIETANRRIVIFLIIIQALVPN